MTSFDHCGIKQLSILGLPLELLDTDEVLTVDAGVLVFTADLEVPVM